MTAPLQRQLRPVVVTAEASTAARLSAALRTAGLEAVCLPCIRILPPADPATLRRAMESISSVDWVVVTSRNGARALSEGVAKSWRGLASKPRVATVGPTTASFVEAAGIDVDLVPDVATSECLAATLLDSGVEGLGVLLLLGDIAGSELEDALTGAGAQVRRVTAYRTVEEISKPEEARSLLLADGEPLIVTFMSASAVRALWGAIGGEVLSHHHIVCIGPASAKEVERLGGSPSRVASPHDVPGLAQAVVEESRHLHGDLS